MQCIHPISVFDKIGLRWIHVPCGKCISCRRRIQNMWAFRCLQEAQNNACSFFVTLTYDDDHLIYGAEDRPTLFRPDVTLWMKRFRKYFPSQTVRYFGCGEYGDIFDRPHYHFILFFNKIYTIDEITEYVTLSWTSGIVDVVRFSSPAQAKYCAKYSMKQVGFDYSDIEPPMAFMSRRPGIGKSYLTELNRKKHRLTWSMVAYDSAGTPYILPRFYRDYFFSKDEQYQMSMYQEKLRHKIEDYRMNIKERLSKEHRYGYYELHQINVLSSFENRYFRTLRITKNEFLKPYTVDYRVYNKNRDLLPNTNFDYE